MLIDVLTFAVLAFFLSRIVSAVRHAARQPMRRHVVEIARGLRLRHFLPVPIVFVAVVSVGLALVQVPGLDFGWWTAIGGQGNPAIGATSRTEGTDLEWVLPLLFITLLIPVLPLFAEREEQMFRAGVEHQSTARRASRCIQFGLIHAIVGIPIGFALALSIGGAYFTISYLRAYRQAAARLLPRGQSETTGTMLTAAPVGVVARRAAIMESTRAHLAYNLTIVALALLTIVTWALTA